MGTELALHLLSEHEVTVWNRTASRTQRLAEAGARTAETPNQAVEGSELIITALFGPQAVRETVIEPGLIPEGTPWMDTTTVSPADAAAFAQAVDTYIAVPVVGTLGPARMGTLGVYVGSPSTELRELATRVAEPWADPERLHPVDTAAKAATGKLLANLALAVSAQGLREALALGAATSTAPEEVLEMLRSTGLDFIAGMKGSFVRGERETEGGDFTVAALAKDARLMLDTIDAAETTRRGADLPALRGALASLSAEEEADRGEHDFSAMLLEH